MERRKGIACCGLACCLCSENGICAGCRNDGCSGKDWCKSLRCCREKGLNGCWECGGFPCDNPMFQKPKVVAFVRFASEFGAEKLMDLLERNESAGVVYHRNGFIGDYDLETEEAVWNLIVSGRTGPVEPILRKADDSMNQEKSCGAVVYSKGGGTLRFLLIRHVNGGHWSFPKGHVEAGESETQTALREIREETGLDAVLDTGFRRITSYSPAEGIWKNVVYFIAKAETGRLNTQKEEILDAGWYPYKEAKKKITYPNDVSLFEEAAAYLGERGGD